jgi:hypothetical protein
MARDFKRKRVGQDTAHFREDTPPVPEPALVSGSRLGAIEFATQSRGGVVNSSSRNYFSIVAQGPGFDVDGYLKRHSMRTDVVWHAGDLHRSGQRLLETNGFEIYMGLDRDISFDNQQSIAATFLEANEVHMSELSALGRGFYLGLRETVTPSSRGSIMDISRSLMQIILRVGIDLTICACVEQDDND